jgi:hypothetical protein
MTHDEARTYVRDHLNRTGNKGPITVTEKLVSRWWNVLNTAVFYDRLLRPIEVKIHKPRSYWGRCTGVEERDNKGFRRVKLDINETFLTKRMFLDVLIHEMVHTWEYQHHTSMGHAIRFFAWKSRIKRTVGLDLEKKTGESDYDVD